MKNDIRETFERFRKALNEGDEWYSSKQNGVPYTQQDEILQTSIQSAKEAFGADFSRLKTPMFYYKEDDDITLSGEIPSLQNAKFQFSYQNGCSFWSADGQVKINEESVDKIAKMYGVFKNWKDELDSMTDRKPMSMKNEG